MLSAPTLHVAAGAIELDPLSESLDADMADALGENVDVIDGGAYARAYRQTGRQDDRARQIMLIDSLEFRSKHSRVSLS